MRMPVNLMLAIGKAALNLAGVGLVGDAVEIARAAWEDWKKSPEERLEELEALVGADDEEIACAAEHMAAELTPGESEPVRTKLATFLKQVPSRIRQSQRRPADPTGRTIRPGFAVSRPDDLIPFIPDQLPRFQAGDRPLPGFPWVLVELLGIGGFGEVWKARHAHLQSRAPVALKFCTDPQARRVLRHDAKVIDQVMLQAQQLGLHLGIVTLQDANLDSEPPYLQYDYVEGGDLAGLIGDWHRQTEKASAELVARAILELAEIVAFAHRLDPPIVHRDLKPANILVQRGADGRIAFKITDFGIGEIATSKAIQTSRQVTSPSQFLATAVRGSGSDLYASPQQFEGKNPDPRDDVHALGVIWYQMMTGDLTRGPSVGQGWRKRFLEQGMSDAMLELLGSCFEEQADRPTDAVVLAETLAALLQPPVVEAMEAKMTEPVKPEPAKVSESPKELVNSIGMNLKWILGGEFLMGSDDSDKDAGDNEKPQHRVRITQPYYLGVHQVTRGQFGRFVQATRYQTEAEKDGEGGYGWDALTGEWAVDPKFTWRSPGFDQTDDHPVVIVGWKDALAFCDWLGKREGQQYRLPTEAEWEYACRAGSTTRYYSGDDPETLVQVGNVADATAKEKFPKWTTIAGRDGYVFTAPVGQFRPNALGLFDMHGNVWEWCSDWYGGDYYKQFKQSPAIDPLGSERAGSRVIRGGGWFTHARYCAVGVPARR